MSVTKRVGRPKIFDEELALRSAVDVFWTKGYDGTSIKDLTKAMGINSPSLYATYGDKETLFVKAIKHYMDNGNCSPLDALEATSDIQDAVGSFFNEVINLSTQEEGRPRGCFLSSCVATCVDSVEGAEKLMAAAIVESEKRISARLEQAKDDGQLHHDFPSESRARLMFDLRQGIVFRARVGTPSKTLRNYIKNWVECVLK
ncbi:MULTISPECIES: TetR/AcrR family transcriptional regulator [Idiomarina]|uniref:TetR/AcrR family transcriptional regulator n=1 Tax=Idiomarina TaxID=135575 RepID=UPI000C474984|nr:MULTISPECIES: TetR/AcrR family transcriptional regulator [Idiomarina]MBP58581.1 TetR family transcriptional regulator [Idiomarina sp.]|tara:strand:- start:469 stop:1074 length:606 start_codon:yes stop_codon:yes gene_type:complete